MALVLGKKQDTKQPVAALGILEWGGYRGPSYDFRGRDGRH